MQEMTSHQATQYMKGPDTNPCHTGKEQTQQYKKEPDTGSCNTGKDNILGCVIQGRTTHLVVEYREGPDTGLCNTGNKMHRAMQYREGPDTSSCNTGMDHTSDHTSDHTIQGRTRYWVVQYMAGPDINP